jgi:hypothetical protein
MPPHPRQLCPVRVLAACRRWGDTRPHPAPPNARKYPHRRKTGGLLDAETRLQCRSLAANCSRARAMALKVWASSRLNKSTNSIELSWSKFSLLAFTCSVSRCPRSSKFFIFCQLLIVSCWHSSEVRRHTESQVQPGSLYLQRSSSIEHAGRYQIYPSSLFFLHIDPRTSRSMRYIRRKRIRCLPSF